LLALFMERAKTCYAAERKKIKLDSCAQCAG